MLDYKTLNFIADTYTPAKESDFAQWASQEGDSTVQEFLVWIQNAKIGDQYISV